MASRLAYYSDQAQITPPILGPRGWSCAAAIGAEETVSISVYPHNGSGSGPELVAEHDDAPCTGCMALLATSDRTCSSATTSVPNCGHFS